MARLFSVTYDSYDNWKGPLNFAIAFHVVIALSIIYLPGLLKPKPKYKDIYTVNLISLNENSIQAAAAQPITKTAPPPPAVKKAAPVKKSTAPATAVQKPVKAVSLKPLKRKIKKKIIPENKQKNQNIERIKREQLAKALQAEQQAAEAARIAAAEAARQKQLLEQQLEDIKRQAQSTSTISSARASSGTANTLSVLDKQYITAIRNRITQFWSLPEFRKWDKNLMAVVVISVAANGRISNHFFEQRSGDPTFDQFVKKTIIAADPLPAIPPALNKQSYEIGLRFKPGSIQ